VLFFLSMRSAQEPTVQNARTSLFSQSKGADGFAFAARSSGSLLTRRRACESSPKARFPYSSFTSFEVLFFLSMRSAQEPTVQNARVSPLSRSKGAEGFAFAARRSGSLLTRRRACESSPKARFPCLPFTSFEVLFFFLDKRR